MRVVAGEFRGRTIVAPKGEGTRPTIDRVREALMSSLYSQIGGFEGVRVLDAFAGSGALGIEALSRGASYADFFEKDRATARTIEANLKACGVGRDRARVHCADVISAFSGGGGASMPFASQPYGLVFLDPPYAYGVQTVAPFILALRDNGALGPDAVIAYEYAQKDAAKLERASDGIDIIGMRKYGKTGVALLGLSER